MTKFVVISKNFVYRFLEQSIFLLIILFVLLAVYVPTKELATVHIADQEATVVRVIAKEDYFIDVNGKLYEVKQHQGQKEAYVDIKVPNEGILYITPVLKEKLMHGKEGLKKISSVIRLTWKKGELSSKWINTEEGMDFQQLTKNLYRLEFDPINVE